MSRTLPPQVFFSSSAPRPERIEPVTCFSISVPSKPDGGLWTCDLEPGSPAAWERFLATPQAAGLRDSYRNARPWTLHPRPDARVLLLGDQRDVREAIRRWPDRAGAGVDWREVDAAGYDAVRFCRHDLVRSLDVDCCTVWLHWAFCGSPPA